jgi:peptidylprolyl isomerase
VKPIVLLFLIAAMSAAATAQTPSSSSSSGTSSAKSASSTSATAKATGSTAEPASWIKLPPGVPRVVHGPVKIPFSLRYEEIKVGTGPEGEAGKVWHLKYTGWRAADGVEFDSWNKHPQPVLGSDGKPVMGSDGKPKMGDPQPAAFLQGVGRVIPGFDYGLAGMKVGGKRRIFIPWQLAYGTHNIPDRPDHPGIPTESDLIFDVELVEVTDAPPMHPMMPMNRPAPNGAAPPHPGAGAQPNAAPSAPPASTAPSGKPAAPATTAPPQPSTPPTTQPQSQSQPK